PPLRPSAVPDLLGARGARRTPASAAPPHRGRLGGGARPLHPAVRELVLRVLRRPTPSGGPGRRPRPTPCGPNARLRGSAKRWKMPPEPAEVTAGRTESGLHFRPRPAD